MNDNNASDEALERSFKEIAGGHYEFSEVNWKQKLELIKNKLGPVLEPLLTESTCVWCKRCLIGIFAKDAIICCNHHPTCAGCWIYRGQSNSTNHGRHSKCRSCNCFYPSQPSSFEPLIEKVGQHIPLMEGCLLVPKGTSCHGWSQVHRIKRTLDQWLLHHFMFHCDTDQVRCNGCGHKQLRGHRQQHLSSECPARMVNCVDCGQSHRLCDQQSHQSTCPRVLVPCPNFGRGCVAQLMRSELTDHVNQCEFRPISCPGCLKYVTFKNSKEHESSCPRMTLHPCPFWSQFSHVGQPELPSDCQQLIPLYRMSPHLSNFETEHHKFLLSFLTISATSTK